MFPGWSLSPKVSRPAIVCAAAHQNREHRLEKKSHCRVSDCPRCSCLPVCLRLGRIKVTHFERGYLSSTAVSPRRPRRPGWFLLEYPVCHQTKRIPLSSLLHASPSSFNLSLPSRRATANQKTTHMPTNTWHHSAVQLVQLKLPKAPGETVAANTFLIPLTILHNDDALTAANIIGTTSVSFLSRLVFQRLVGKKSSLQALRRSENVSTPSHR